MAYYDVVIYLYAFLIGACIASFANVAIYRIPKNESIATGRSYCDNCHRMIAWYDLIPIVSYLLLRGKCRYCKAKIGIIHPIIECLGGLILMICFYRFGLTWLTLLSFLIGIVLLVIAVIDYKTMDIYDSTIIALLLLTLVYRYFSGYDFISMLIGALSVSGVMFIITLIIRSGFGFGDIELMFVSGLLLGWQINLLAAFLGIMLGGIYASYLLITKQVGPKAHIAFGPYLAVGIFIALLYGHDILTWYFALFAI